MSSQTFNAEVVDAVFRERDQLKVENARLRGLVADTRLEVREVGPWKELSHGGAVTESYIRPSEEGSICPYPNVSVTFEGQKFTFDAEDSERFTELLERHLRKLAGVEVAP